MVSSLICKGFVEDNVSNHRAEYTFLRISGVGNDSSPISSSDHVEFVTIESKKNEAKCAKKEMIVDIKFV